MALPWEPGCEWVWAIAACNFSLKILEKKQFPAKLHIKAGIFKKTQGFIKLWPLEVLEDEFFFSSFPIWDLYLPHSYFLPPQQGVEREEPASEVLISFSLQVYAEQRRTGAVLLLSSPGWVMQQLRQLLPDTYFIQNQIFLWPSTPS